MSDPKDNLPGAVMSNPSSSSAFERSKRKIYWTEAQTKYLLKIRRENPKFSWKEIHQMFKTRFPNCPPLMKIRTRYYYSVNSLTFQKEMRSFRYLILKPESHWVYLNSTSLVTVAVLTMGYIKVAFRSYLD
eukprot:982392_1